MPTEEEELTANVTPSPIMSSNAISNQQSNSTADMSDLVSCREPKSANTPITPSVLAVKTKQQIEEEEREKMQ